MMPQPLVVDVKEAAKTLGVSVWVMRHYIASGLIPTIQFPSTKRPGESTRRVLIAVADLNKFVEQHRELSR